jgi:predicted secreted protein
MTVLEFGIQDIYGTTPNMEAAKMSVVREASASEQFDRCERRWFIGDVIPEIDGMIQGERPKRKIGLIRPHENRVK